MVKIKPILTKLSKTYSIPTAPQSAQKDWKFFDVFRRCDFLSDLSGSEILSNRASLEFSVGHSVGQIHFPILQSPAERETLTKKLITYVCLNVLTSRSLSRKTAENLLYIVFLKVQKTLYKTFVQISWFLLIISAKIIHFTY